MSPKTQRRVGAFLTVCAVAATLWLAATNQLVLYIHPRYVLFTVIMALLAAAVLVVAGVRAITAPREHDHDHAAHLENPAPRKRAGKILSLLTVALVMSLAIAMLVLPPATLSSATAIQRDVTGTISAGGPHNTKPSPTGATTRFSILDWSVLLRQTTDSEFYSSKPADVVGFVVAQDSDPDVMYVSRFVITCCAVDAQPVAVPVYLPGWRQEHKADSWIRVRGTFRSNPSQSSTISLALLPDSITDVPKPASPYLF